MSLECLLSFHCVVCHIEVSNSTGVVTEYDTLQCQLRNLKKTREKIDNSVIKSVHNYNSVLHAWQFFHPFSTDFHANFSWHQRKIMNILSSKDRAMHYFKYERILGFFKKFNGNNPRPKLLLHGAVPECMQACALR